MKKKKASGRPVKNIAEPIPASPKEIAETLFRSADKKIPKRTRKSPV